MLSVNSIEFPQVCAKGVGKGDKITFLIYCSRTKENFKHDHVLFFDLVELQFVIYTSNFFSNIT